MSRALVTIRSRQDRDKLKRLIDAVPDLSRVEVKAPKRSLPQNDALWGYLTSIAEQLTWHGKRYSAPDWKDYLMHQLRKARWMPDEDGGYVPIGMHSSDLTREEMSDLLEIVQAFAARNGVTLHQTEPKQAEAA